MLSEDSASTVRWLRLDCSPLKQQLVGLCDGWVAAFQGLLACLAARQLAALEQELGAHVAALQGRPAPAATPQEGQQQEDAGEAGEAAAEAGGAQQQDGEGDAGSDAGGQDAAAALEALHARLEGERGELAARLEACREKYEALAGLQVGGRVLVAAAARGGLGALVGGPRRRGQ